MSLGNDARRAHVANCAAFYSAHQVRRTQVRVWLYLDWVSEINSRA